MLLIRSPSSSERQEICALTGTGKNVIENVNGKTINHNLNSVIHCSLRVILIPLFMTVVSLIRNEHSNEFRQVHHFLRKYLSLNDTITDIVYSSNYFMSSIIAHSIIPCKENIMERKV